MAPFLVFVLGCLFGASVAAPLTKILEYDAGTHSRVEAGTPGQSVTGSFSWQSGDQLFHMDYVADENGYRPIMKVTRIGSADAKVQPVPYIQQIIPAVPAPVVAPVAQVVPVAPPAPVQELTKIIQAAPEPAVIKVEVAPAKVEATAAVVAAEPAKFEPEPVKVEESVKVEAEPVKAELPEADDDAIQVTASADAAGEEPDQLKGALLMNTLAQEYEQQLLEEQQYLAALAEAQQDERPSSYALTQEEEAELALLQLMQLEQQLAKQIESQPDDQSSSVRLALEYEKQLARELEQQAYLRQLAEAELFGLQQSTNDDANAYLRQIFDYDQQQQLMAQLAGVDGSAYLRQLTGYEPELIAQLQQQQQSAESIDGYTVNARELSDYEKALEALYFGGQ